MYQGKFEAKNRPQRAAGAPASGVSGAAAPTPSGSAASTHRSKRKKKVSRKGNPIITAVFYTLYFVMILAFVGGTFYALNFLEAWLIDYEAAQPTAKCNEVFSQIFADPDWGSLYEQAGLEDTVFEGADTYVAYMENKVGDTPLTYIETSAGLSGGRKYYIALGQERLGHFTMVDMAPDGADLSDWRLGEIELYVEREETVLIQKLGDHVISVNGVTLDDSYTIQITSTTAEEYLPAGASGIRYELQMVTDLLSAPEITATDAEGNATQLVYDEAAGIYVEQTAVNTISDAEKDVVLSTAKTFSLYMIEHASRNELAKCFDTSSQSYKTIISIDPWMQDWFFQSYEFANENVTGYSRYSDDLFSVHVELSMFVTRTDNTVKDYPLDHTFFFEKQNGSWKCINVTNVDVQEQVSTVRLTFMQDDLVLSSEFYDSDIPKLETPVISVPEGQVFAGWFREEVDENGVITLNLVFTPDENGIVPIPEGNLLEPMTLYALFEAAQ